MGTSGELNVALVALVISLIALVVTTVQLLTQLFGTADGTRKCSSSVLGEWGKLTRWRWRWSEGRFETLYTVPEICLGEVPLRVGEGMIAVANSEHALDKTGHWLAGSDPSLRRLIANSKDITGENELAGWVIFLQFLDQNSEFPLKVLDHNPLSYNILCWPYIALRQRSWDFMPPDVVRPLASTNISDFAIIIRRLGLIWKDFDPANGKMTAEGGPHVISSVTIRGIGLVLQYKCTDRNIGIGYSRPIKQLIGKRKVESQEMTDLKDQRINIWTREMDKILFGILPGNQDLGLPDFCIATHADCMDVLEQLNERDKKVVELVKKDGWFRFYEFNDLIPLAAPVFRQRGTTDQVTSLKNYWACLFTFEPAFITFTKCLRDFNQAHDGGTSQTRWVLEKHESLRLNWGSPYEKFDPFSSLLDLLEYQHDLYDETTSYFQTLESREKSPIKYFDLLKAHFSKAPLASIEARSRHDRGHARTDPDYKSTHVWRIENMYLYFEYIPDYIKFMEKKGCSDPMLVSEAWITLVFRALCWRKLHHIKDLDGGYIPTEHYGSQQPIYLG